MLLHLFGALAIVVIFWHTAHYEIKAGLPVKIIIEILGFICGISYLSATLG